MDDIAVFKLDSLPDITFTVTRTTQPAPMPSGGTKPIGFLDFVGRREFVPGIASQAGVPGPTGPEMVETPRIPGGKVPFVFRTLPGYTFYAIRFDHEILDKDLRGGTERRAPGWIRVTYYGPGDDEERELCGFAGPQS
jgi:hypothetical protein